jgi:ribonuclease-3
MNPREPRRPWAGETLDESYEENMAKSEDVRRQTDLSQLERDIGISFGDRELLARALTHKSYAYEVVGVEHNESLEFLGDAVLGFIVTDLVFHTFPDFREGRKSKIKAYLVSANTLSGLSQALSIPQYVRLGRGEEKTGGRKKKALCANTFEALVAAVYLEAGIEATREFLTPLYEPLLQNVRSGKAIVEDAKTALQEFLQAQKLSPPHYELTGETGPEHRKTFHVELRVGRRKLGRASGRTKKGAELMAARAALDKLLTEQGQSKGQQAQEAKADDRS